MGLGLGLGLGKTKKPEFGPELVEGWNTAAFWFSVGAPWSFDEGVKILSDGGSGSLLAANLWVIGKKFKITISAVRNSGTLIGPYDGSGAPPGSVITASGDYEYDYEPDGSTNLNIYSSSFNGEITALSIKQYL